MVNFGLNSASILGIILAVAGAALYFLRSMRPELARDHDIFFAAVGLLCGFILLFQGWRLDPILQFGQLLLSGTTIFFAVESVRLRSVATEQAKRNTRIVDEERPVSRVYQYAEDAELYDPIEPGDEEVIPRRIPGSRDNRPSRSEEYDDDTPRRRRYDDYEDDSRRRSATRTSTSERSSTADRPRKQRRPRSTSRPVEQPEDEWGSSRRSYNDDEWESSTRTVTRPTRSSSDGSSRSEIRNPEVPSRPRKRRSSQEAAPRRQSGDDVEVRPTNYVDYRPIDSSDKEPDNLSNFDEA